MSARARGGRRRNIMQTMVPNRSSSCVPHTLADMTQHAHWDRAANPVLRTQGVPVLPVWASTSMAWDAHVGHGDCTHFCQPGIPDLWARSLFEILAKGHALRSE